MTTVTYVSKGFIDPRRPDSISIIFETKVDLSDLPEPEDAAKRSIIGSKLREDLKEKFPEVERFKGRESWFLVDDSEIIGRLSGNGPTPPYDTPFGEIVDIRIYLP